MQNARAPTAFCNADRTCSSEGASPHGMVISSHFNDSRSAIFAHLCPKLPPFTVTMVSPELQTFTRVASIAPLPEHAKNTGSKASPSIQDIPSCARVNSLVKSCERWCREARSMACRMVGGISVGPGVKRRFLVDIRVRTYAAAPPSSSWQETCHSSPTKCLHSSEALSKSSA